MARSKNEFQTIHSEGGLLPPDLLRRVVDPKANLAGTKPEDYGLPQGERLNEAITQSWNRMRRHWAEFRAAAANLPENEPGTGLTNDKWSVPLLRELGFGLLPTSAGPEINGRTYAINRFFGPTAVHLVGCGLSLDRRAAGVRGAAATNPHGLVQEFLNRSPSHLWAVVSNGLRFRVLRDNQALSRQSYLEFDLEAMFSGEVFPDFVLLWLMAHATRFAPQTEGRPETCWLEQWTKIANEEGTRALGDLRAGVEKALQILGEAFVSHPRNTALREALRSETLTLSDFHGQLLRLVYRLIFLFVAEDRTLDGVSLLHPRDDSEAGRQARARYDANYSTARLRDLAAKIKGSRHGDLWQQFNLLVGALSGDERFETARPHLALPVLGSFLWSPKSTSALNAANLQVGDGVELANADFLEALRHLAYTRQGKVLRPVDYKNLGAEELGGVYETLLALTPQISGDGSRFTFAEFAGNERKTSGSYYTPDSLVQCLLDSALDPVVEEALKGKSGEQAEQAILNLKVCDPAVGSGHFLVGAAHRLARHLARVRANAQGESEPSPLLYQHALRDVIGRCLYGVDINPMSAELCRVSLWLEALEPGKPLSFLDHHIQVGNSLLGTTPALLAQGIPDDAFKPIEGDVKSRCTELKRENKRERQEYKTGQGYLFDPPHKLGNLAAEFAKIDAAGDDTPEAVQEKERRYAELVKGQAYQFGRLLADTWCAAFVWRKDDSDLAYLCPTERYFRRVESHAAAGLLPHVREEVQRLAQQYQFFHWHLAFPDVFRLPGNDERPENEHTGWSGGFDVVLGNPPFLGGLKISEHYGDRYRAFLTTLFEPYAGRADLCAAFFRLAFLSISQHGRVGLIATKTIGQGETRESGLAVLLNQGAQITLAKRFVTWPGSANVEVNLLVLAKTELSGDVTLDDRRVPFVSSRLDDQPELVVEQLPQNRGKAFQGSIVLGPGFVIPPSRAQEFIQLDPHNAECLFPYYSGEDINTSPLLEPSRWVIQFDERTEAEAKSYAALWSHVEQHVRPERQTKDAAKYPRMVHEWWKHWNNRQELYGAVRPLSRALARSRVSELHMLAFLPTNAIYSDATVVFAFDDDIIFAILQSDVHEAWVRREASTMRTDVRYTPTDCFSTFAFPEAATTSDQLGRQLATIGHEYDQYRGEVLRARGIGLTKLYNLIHDPACSAPEIVTLRKLHATLTTSVLSAYSWSDIAITYEFHSTDRGRIRYSLADASRLEILRRLNQLNASYTHQRKDV